MKHTFNCSICQEEHAIYTLIEMPQPIIITDITSGQLELPLQAIAKDVFMINQEYLYFESELSIPIKEYEDSLDFLIWVKVWENEFISKQEAPLADRFIELRGKLDAYIPFYPETFEQGVNIRVDNQLVDKSYVTKIDSFNELSVDFEKGISWERLIYLLERYYHP